MPRGERGTARPYLRGKIWWIKYYVPGEEKPRYESSKSTDKKEAQRLLNQRRSEIDRRRISSSKAVTRDLLQLYLADQKKHARNSWKQAEGYVRLHLAPALGNVRASEVTSSMIDHFIEQKQRAAYANATINRWLEALKRAYILGMSATPPLVYSAPKFQFLEEDNVREGFLEHDQYLALRRELPDHQRIVLEIGYHLGMRRGEILSLRWDQIDWSENLIRLERRQTKNKRGRWAPMYGELRACLDMAYSARCPDCPFVVVWCGQGIVQSKTAWNKARMRAGVPDLLVHDLRRTAVRNMVRAGIPEKQAMLISGHRTRSIFDRYDITDERDIRAAGQKLEKYLVQKEAVVTKIVTQIRLEKSSIQKEGVPLQ